MNTKLDDLSECFKPLACELLARCVERRIHVRIINTLRTAEEQADCIARGVSWTKNSKHLVGKAIDIAPEEVLGLKNWAPGHPLWMELGEIGENLGLVWGGRWTRGDMAHFEMKE